MIKQKIIDAIKDMESKVSRDSEHIYRNNETGEMLQGVSTVSSIFPKDWLSAWGAKEAVKALGYTDYEDMTVTTEVFQKIRGMSDVNEYLVLLKEAKGAHARKSKKALIDGTLGHKWLESYVEAKINGSIVPQIPLGTTLERPVTQFLEWAEREVDYWIASEAKVCNLEKKYGGQLDAIAMMKSGGLSLVDFKFASNISEDYYLQTGGYGGCFDSYGVRFDRRIIIRLPKTLEKEVYENYKYRMVPNDIEVKDVPTPYEVDRDAFYACLPVKQWINYVKKLTNNK